ncbi:MAG: ParA family protein [Alphaproteobacteria bacterium]|nr:ParA family protein [Alphaproteobacteria bacterium]
MPHENVGCAGSAARRKANRYHAARSRRLPRKPPLARKPDRVATRHQPKQRAMTGKIISVCNMKGGVGKTTLVVSLAETLAAGGVGKRMKVLVIDLDAQAHASFCIAGDELLMQLFKEHRSLDFFFEDAVLDGRKKQLNEFIRESASSMTAGGEIISLALAPASERLRYVERSIIHKLTSTGTSFDGKRVRDLVANEIELLRNVFDVIIIDCPPGISIFTEAALWASDIVLAPVIMDKFSVLGLTTFCKHVLAAPRRHSAILPYVLANRVQPTNVAKRVLQALRAEAAAHDAGFRMLKTEIPQSATLVKAMACEDDAPTYALKYGNARQDLENLAREIVEIINADRPSGRPAVSGLRQATRPVRTETRGLP